MFESLDRSDSYRFGVSNRPRINFPCFDGEHPKLWISRCEDYFDLFPMEPHRWVKLAAMHMSDDAGRWLPSVDEIERQIILICFLLMSGHTGILLLLKMKLRGR